MRSIRRVPVLKREQEESVIFRYVRPYINHVRNIGQILRSDDP